jgi:Asp-tRNA(Asn)/Glu-tRNA(Gln) amidotransferase C subunit
MSAEFSTAQVAAIAALAHLELDQSELELFAKQLSEILAYAEEVQQVRHRRRAADRKRRDPTQRRACR